MDVRLTKEQKLANIGIDEADYRHFSDYVTDTIYDKVKHIESINKHDKFLYFLNEILSTCNHDKIESSTDFKMMRTDIIKFDGIVFFKKYKKELYKCGMTMGDLQYGNHTKIQTYGLTLIKSICKFYKYELKTKMKSLIVDDKKISERYYYIENTA